MICVWNFEFFTCLYDLPWSFANKWLGCLEVRIYLHVFYHCRSFFFFKFRIVFINYKFHYFFVRIVKRSQTWINLNRKYNPNLKRNPKFELIQILSESKIIQNIHPIRIKVRIEFRWIFFQSELSENQSNSSESNPNPKLSTHSFMR